MGKQHDPYLAWKIKHGLARRGQTGGRMHPKGLLSGILYKYFYSKHDKSEDPPPGATFDQKVGGTLGPVGKVK